MEFLLAVLASSLCISAVAPPSTLVETTQEANHDKAFWTEIIQNEYKVPKGENAFELAKQLDDMFESPDPELRDEIAYSILTQWIYQQQLFSKEEIGTMLNEWSANLKAGIGQSNHDSVLLRSFSALNLASLVALDNRAKDVLSKEQVQSLLNNALTYLDQEVDIRGWDKHRGWMHSAAHTADLLKFLARSRHIDQTDQSAILNGIGKKLASTHGLVFQFGEDDRLAAAILSIIYRADFDPVLFDEFLASLDRHSVKLRPESGFGIDFFAAKQNEKNLLRALYFQLVQIKKPTDNHERTKKAVLKKLTIQ